MSSVCTMSSRVCAHPAEEKNSRQVSSYLYVMYGVATINRLLKVIGLFCNFFAKEPYKYNTISSYLFVMYMSVHTQIY